MQQPKLYDIYDVHYQPWWMQTWLIISVLGLIAVALGYAVYRWYTQEQEETIEYWYKILETLEEFHEVSDTDDMSDLYSLFTLYVKEYICRRFDFSTRALTDDEFLQLLQVEDSIPDWVKRDVQSMFESVTFIKFAGALASNKRLVKDVEMFKNIINRTHNKEQKKEAL